MPKSFLLKRNLHNESGGIVSVKVKEEEREETIGNNHLVNNDEDGGSTDEEDAWKIGEEIKLQISNPIEQLS